METPGHLQNVIIEKFEFDSLIRIYKYFTQKVTQNISIQFNSN